MQGIAHEKIIEIIKEYRKNVSWDTWKIKNSVMFTIKAKYGDSINMKSVGVIYDSLTAAEIKERAEENETRRT